jgi:hypothetical protein
MMKHEPYINDKLAVNLCLLQSSTLVKQLESMSLTSCHSNVDGNISKFGNNKPIEILKLDYIIFALQRSEE